MWTLHNPPNVVIEALPNDGKGMQTYTQRIRRRNDSPPLYIKTWDHCEHYCDIYGIPHDFLSEGQVRPMHVGLPRDNDGFIIGNNRQSLPNMVTDLLQHHHSTHSIQSPHLRAPIYSHHLCAALIYLASSSTSYSRQNQGLVASAALFLSTKSKTILSLWLWRRMVSSVL